MLGLHRRQLQYLADPYVQPVSTPAARSSSTSGVSDSQVATRSVPIPPGAQIGDVVQVAIELWDSTATNPTITPPDGQWTLVVNYVSATDGFQKLKVWQKPLLVTEAGQWSFVGFGSHFSQGQAIAVTGVNLTSPLDGAVSTAQNSTGTALPANSKTTTGADFIVYWVANENSSTETPPTGYTELQEANYLKLNTKLQGGAGTETIADGSQSVSTLKLGALIALTPSGGGGITGTVAVTETADTSSATGQLGYSGTSARTEANDTSSATGTVVNPVTGTSARTQADQTSSATGQLGYSGTSARTEAADTSAASGQLGYSGTSAQTQANQTSTASGTFTAGGSFVGTVVVTQANQTSVASGQLGYSGTAARTQAGNTSAAAGTVINPVTGTASPVQANQTSAGVGKLGYTGTAARTQANQTATAVGVVVSSITGTAAASQANQTASITGYFAALVSFGTSGAGGGTAPSSHPNQGLVPFSTPAAGTAPSASGGSTGIPTSTGA